MIDTVSDGLNRVAFADDAQIAEISVRKVWGEASRTVVSVEEIGAGYTFCAASPEKPDCVQAEAEMSGGNNWKSIGELARKLSEDAEKARKGKGK